MAETTGETRAHVVMKESYTKGTKIYRVTINENKGPSIVSLGRLSSGQTFTFDRLSEDNNSTTLRLTQAEVRNLRDAHFNVEEATKEDIKSIDPFNEPMADSVVTEKDWTLVQTPAEYLDNTPNGPKAELATRMIEAGLPNVSRGKVE